MNEPGPVQLATDPRTGLLTAISGEFAAAAAHAACSALNHGRIRGIQKATHPAPSGEPFEAHGWYAAVAARAVDWEVPLVPLDRFGFVPSDEDFEADLNAAVDRMKAVPPRPSLGHGIRVFWIH